MLPGTKHVLFMDIETVSAHKDYESFIKADPRGADTFKLKNHRCVANGNSQWTGDINENYKRNAPLLAEYNTIICISYAVVNDSGTYNPGRKTIVDTGSEEELVKIAAKILQKSHDNNMRICGHNIRNFDIPVLVKKMLKYRINIPQSINTADKKPWEVSFIDTSDLLKGTGNTITSLHDATYLLGIETPKDDLHGDQVSDYYHSGGDISRVSTYCDKDVLAVFNIYSIFLDCTN